MRILISVALWGRGYCKLFADYALASQLSPGNLPALAREHEVTYQILTPKADARWLGRHPALQKLKRHCRIQWDLLERQGFMPDSFPTGHEGIKYSFVSLLQNIAIKTSLDFDALIFNYADFIWADGALSNAVRMLTSDTDAVLSFCLPVDRDEGVAALDEIKDKARSELTMPARVGADLALRHLHREAKLRYWNDPAFTVTPTYLLWQVGDEGAIIRAYHQTVLVLRVRPDDPDYRNGIPRGSLDGYFTGILAERARVCHATSSEQVFVFSLYHTPVESRIGGPSRANWEGFDRDASMRECLRGVISPGQRNFAMIPVEVQRAAQRSQAWDRATHESAEILRIFHETTAFDPEEHHRLHNPDGETLEQLANRWRQPSVPLDPPWTRQVMHFLIPSREMRSLLRGRADAIYRLILIGLASSAGRRVKAIIGPRMARALRLRAERLIFGAERSLFHPPVPQTALPPNAVPAAAGAATATIWPSDEEARNLLRRGQIEALLGRVSRAFFVRDLVPNVRIGIAAQAAMTAGLFSERLLNRLADLGEVVAILGAAERLFRIAIEQAPFWPAPYEALGRNLWFQGRLDEAIAAFAEADGRVPELAKAAGWDPEECVILPRNTAHVIGLMGHLDSFVKRKILTQDSRRLELIAPIGEVVNVPFLDYWKQYVTVEHTAPTESDLRPEEAAYTRNWHWALPWRDSLVHVHRGMARTQRAWQEAFGDKPLLRLRPDHQALLEAQRLAWGMGPDDWYVCLHVRSAGFYTEQDLTAQHFRNTPITDYHPMIRWVVEAGGWVVRMGDAAMPPLDLSAIGGKPGRIIDYAHRPDKSAALDVALCAGCRLFVSSPSGLHTVAHAFGRPACYVNFPIYAGFPWHPGEIFIFQRYYSRILERVLTLDEILSSDLVHADHNFMLDHAGVELLRNSPTDILETVREALQPGRYTFAGAERGREVRDAFDRLNKLYGVDISGTIGLHFAASNASELVPEGSDGESGTPRRFMRLASSGRAAGGRIEVEAVLATERVVHRRKLDVIVPSYNRPARLHKLLQSGLALGVPGLHLVVIDDGSDLAEEVPDLGMLDTEAVCRSFDDPRIIYLRNPQNMGVARSWERYYQDFCDADYTMSVTDKDEFIDGAPIVSALAKLDAAPDVSMVVLPMRQRDRGADDREMSFSYGRMPGAAYLATYVNDPMLMHCSMWGVIRVAAARAAGVPRLMDLRRYGLDDGFGIDIDFVFMVAAQGNVDFEDRPHVRRSTLAGGTERYPLTFAYTYYQYARRAMRDLRARGAVSRATERTYVAMWILLISRGLLVAFRPVHGTELEPGTRRIAGHLRIPIHLYLILQCLRYRVKPTSEIVGLWKRTAKIMIRTRLKELCGKSATQGAQA